MTTHVLNPEHLSQCLEDNLKIREENCLSNLVSLQLKNEGMESAV